MHMGNRRTGAAVQASAFLLSMCSVAAAADLRLVDAVQRQDRTAVRALLKERVDVNTPQPDGATALAWAAHWDDLETADMLIRAGADVDAANDYGVTALALACANGSAAMAEKLLAAGANPNTARSTGETPLMTAAHTGNEQLVKALLARGAAANGNNTASKQTALMFAIAESHASITRLLVEAGADVRARSAGGFTPLLFAARHGDVASARTLLAAGADVDEAAPDGNTALVVATASGREGLALLLLESGANPNADGAGYTALHAAVPEDAQTVVKALLARGASPNARLRNAPPRIFGPARGAGSEVAAAVPAAAVLSAPPAGGSGGAAAAARSGSDSLKGATPFWLAARSVNVDILRALADGGADPSLTTDNGTTPLMAAAGLTQVQGPRARRGDVSQFYSNWGESDSLDSVRFLIQLGADVNATNHSRQTALHGAAYMGGNPIIQLLVEQGARLNPQDAQGQTPFRIAEAHLNVASQGVSEWPKTAALLRQLGADTALGFDARTILRRYDKKQGAVDAAVDAASGRDGRR